MSILEQLSLQMARGMDLGLEKGTDVLGAMRTGKQLAQAEQSMRIKSMEMREYTEQRTREKRLRDSMKGADFGDYEATTEAAQRASDVGDYKTAMSISKHALSQKPKKGDAFGPMQDVYIKGSKIGVGQYDNEGKLSNFKTTKQMTGDNGLDKPLKPSRASEGQKKEAVEYLKRSKYFGEEGLMDTGFSNKDYKELGSTVASRAQKIMVDAKQVKQSISYIEARDIAVQEVEAMGDSIFETDVFGMGKNLKKDEIKFKPGLSTPLLEKLGVSLDPSAKPAGIEVKRTTKDGKTAIFDATTKQFIRYE